MPASPKAAQGKSGGKKASRSSSGKSNGAKSPAAKPPAPAPAAAPAEEPQEPPKISVTLTLLGTGDQPFELAPKSTVADLLEEAGLSAKTGEVLVNSRHVTIKHELEAGAQVVFASNIEGGCR